MNKKILITTNIHKDESLEKTKNVITFLQEKGCMIYVPSSMYSRLHSMNVYEFHDEKMFCCIVLGGDGTFLSTVHQYATYHFPFVGINLGRVGYLSEVTDEHTLEFLNDLLNEKYDIQEKSFIEVSYFDENQQQQTKYAFNEVVLHRGLFPKMLKMEVQMKEGWQHSFYADGLLVATTMGSSAYNLSAGGPLLLPQAKCFVMTAICSQFGIMPSIVTSDEDAISISFQETSSKPKVLITIDGEEQCFLDVSKTIEIKKAKETLYIINMKNHQIRENHITKMFNGYMK